MSASLSLHPAGQARAAAPIVAMVVSEGLGPFHLAGPLMVMSRNYSNESPVDLRICTVTPGMVRTTIEFDISRAQDLEICDRA